MSLSEREQRALDAMAGELAGSDSGLVSLLATFTRLTADEVLPARETIQAIRPGLMQAAACLAGSGTGTERPAGAAAPGGRPGR